MRLLPSGKTIVMGFLLAVLVSCADAGSESAAGTHGEKPKHPAPSQEQLCQQKRYDLVKEVSQEKLVTDQVQAAGVEPLENEKGSCQKIQDFLAKQQPPVELLPTEALRNLRYAGKLTTKLEGGQLNIVASQKRVLYLVTEFSKCGQVQRTTENHCQYPTAYQVQDFAIGMKSAVRARRDLHLEPGASSYLAGLHFYQGLPYGSDPADQEINDRLYFDWSLQKAPRQSAVLDFLRTQPEILLNDSSITSYRTAGDYFDSAHPYLIGLQMSIDSEFKNDASYWAVTNPIVYHPASDIEDRLLPFNLGQADLDALDPSQGLAKNILYSGHLVFDSGAGAQIACQLEWPDPKSCQRFLTDSFSKIFRAAVSNSRPVYVRMLWKPKIEFAKRILSVIRIDAATGESAVIQSVDASEKQEGLPAAF